MPPPPIGSARGPGRHWSGGSSVREHSLEATRPHANECRVFVHAPCASTTRHGNGQRPATTEAYHVEKGFLRNWNGLHFLSEEYWSVEPFPTVPAHGDGTLRVPTCLRLSRNAAGNRPRGPPTSRGRAPFLGTIFPPRRRYLGSFVVRIGLDDGMVFVIHPLHPRSLHALSRTTRGIVPLSSRCSSTGDCNGYSRVPAAKKGTNLGVGVRII